MRSRLFGLLAAGGILLGTASVSNAQIVISGGSPYAGPGISIGQPVTSYGYGNTYTRGYTYNNNSTYSNIYGAPAPGMPVNGVTTYSSGYSRYVAPGTTYYGNGYVNPAPYGNRAYYGTPGAYAPAPGYYAPAPAYGYSVGRGGWRW